MTEWMNDPMLKHMDPAKIELIRLAASQTSGKSGSSLAPILLSLITNANKKGIQFTPDEVTLIFQLLKKGKSPSEQQNIDRTIQMVSSMIQKNKTAR